METVQSRGGRHCEISAAISLEWGDRSVDGYGARARLPRRKRLATTTKQNGAGSQNADPRHAAPAGQGNGGGVGEVWLLRDVVRKLRHKFGGPCCQPQAHNHRTTHRVPDGSGGGGRIVVALCRGVATGADGVV